MKKVSAKKTKRIFLEIDAIYFAILWQLEFCGFVCPVFDAECQNLSAPCNSHASWEKYETAAITILFVKPNSASPDFSQNFGPCENPP